MLKEIMTTIFTLFFLVTVLIGLENEMYTEMFTGGSTEQLSKETKQITRNVKEQLKKAYADKDVVMDDTYYHEMNEEVEFHSSPNRKPAGDLVVNVKEAFLTRDLSDYASLFFNNGTIYLNKEWAAYANENAVFLDKYYYAVVILNIKNNSSDPVQVLVPETFSYVYVDKTKPSKPQLMGSRITFCKKLNGDGVVSLKDELVIQPRECYTYAMMTIMDEEKYNDNLNNNKAFYLCTNSPFKERIPEDNNMIQLIKINFKMKEE